MILYTPVVVFMVTTFTIPSLPVRTYTTLPSGHFVEITLCSHRITLEEKSFRKSSFQLGMSLEKGQKQGRAERTQEPDI